MNKEYVQEYGALEKNHWWFIVRQRILTSFLEKYSTQKSLKILNVGAAAGASSCWLAAFGEVVSLETDPFFTEYLLQQNTDVVNASVTSMPFPDETFDLVCAFDVIEHVQQHEVALKELERVCKAGGLVYLTVPASPMLWSRHDVVNCHYRRYTKSSLLQLLASFSSLHKVEIKYFNSFLFVPILLARKALNLFGSKKNHDSDFTNFKTGNLSNRILKGIFSLEANLITYLSFPVGVSLLGIWKKEVNLKPVTKGKG